MAALLTEADEGTISPCTGCVRGVKSCCYALDGKPVNMEGCDENFEELPGIQRKLEAEALQRLRGGRAP